jgi:hypothetical protein
MNYEEALREEGIKVFSLANHCKGFSQGNRPGVAKLKAIYEGVH